MTSATPAGIPKRLGHIALRVRDVPKAVTFYSEVLGLDVRHAGEKIAFLGVRPDASHELALFGLGDDAEGPDEKRVGMYHMAWEMASLEEVQALNQRLIARGADIAGYSDRQCNVMFHDPDGNELEAIWEPTKEELEALGGAIPTLGPA